MHLEIHGCPARPEWLLPNDTGEHCSHCERQVVDLSRLSEGEALRKLREATAAGVSLCVSVLRAAQGRIRFRDRVGTVSLTVLAGCAPWSELEERASKTPGDDRSCETEPKAPTHRSEPDFSMVVGWTEADRAPPGLSDPHGAEVGIRVRIDPAGPVPTRGVAAAVEVPGTTAPGPEASSRDFSEVVEDARHLGPPAPRRPERWIERGSTLPDEAISPAALEAARIAFGRRARPPTVVRGQVRDGSSRAPIAGARVVFSSASLADPVATTTDHRGHFDIRALPAGEYLIEFFAGEDLALRTMRLDTRERVWIDARVHPPGECTNYGVIPPVRHTSVPRWVSIQRAP